MAKTLVIVESPAKSKTINKYLGKDYIIAASKGHVIDLPVKSLGVDIENGFAPEYKTIRGKGEVIKNLKKLAKSVDQVYLATDPDREGEAISWHLANALKIDEKSICRVTFNEITKAAVTEAINNPTPINLDMVDSYQARRVLDRIVGYKISPYLWKRIKKGLSAGRVQSVSLKLICEREDVINAFKSEEYWNIMLDLKKDGDKMLFSAKYFGGAKKIAVLNEEQAKKIVEDTKNAELIVSDVKTSKRTRRPSAPFITSTLQQEASSKLGYAPSKTMIIAQQLYEGVDIKGQETVGLITYMRTDSKRISPEIQLETRKKIAAMFGDEYVPKTITTYKNKSNSQDAHEAIRPTNIELLPNAIKDSLTSEQVKIYKLIYDRFFASQMSPATFDQTKISIKADEHIYKASGSVISFRGFLAVYEATEIVTKEVDVDEAKNNYLPKLVKKDLLKLKKIEPLQKFTQPPKRFSEAALIKMMEEKGIGRPSTYAPTISTIKYREYVEKIKSLLKPTELGTVVNGILNKNFSNIVDYSFTTQMEENLDNIEQGKANWVQVLEDFYTPFELSLEEAKKDNEKIILQSDISDVICEECGKNLLIKTGRYGKFLACPGYPDCKNTKPYTEDANMKCPMCNSDVFYRYTKKNKKFLGCSNYPECKWSSWHEPTNEICPKCGKQLLKGKVNYKPMITCANDDCDFEKLIEKDKE